MVQQRLKEPSIFLTRKGKSSILSPFFHPSPALRHFGEGSFLEVSPLKISFSPSSTFKVEGVSFKVLQSHYCIWEEEESFHVEDVEAQIILSVFETKLIWLLEAVSELLRGSEDRYHQKPEDLD